jgi:divalent metal cation (Fe/Co/Zn/Cd) transporter
MGLAVSLFILISGISLVKKTISPLLGTAPDKGFVDRIYKKIQDYDGILGLHDLEVHTYGPSKCFASVHCEVSPELDIMSVHDIMDEIERDFLEKNGIHLVIHPDPIEIDDKRTNELRMKVAEILSSISSDLRMHDFRISRGRKSVKLIFDIQVPFGFSLEDDELTRIVVEKIRRMNPAYSAVITIDHQYSPDF